MDYDDNDFQSQNLHLAGEGSNKYPPVLQPYALPKFDFDDNLNGHLRFDSLVETEVFLGIEGNEDNRWIEDFSRGSSSVVFSSSAAESCAISRHNNVWSEATSSESVEMLLKSVGQDDVVTRESTAKESDTGDELGCIIEQMEPSQKCKESNLAREETVDLPPTLSADKIPGDPSGFKEGEGGEQHLLGGASQVVEHESSVEGKSSISGRSTASENTDITFNLRKESGDAEQTPVDQNEIETDVTDSLGKRQEEDNSESGVPVGDLDPSLQNVISGRSELDDQNTLQPKDDIGDGLQNRNYNSNKEGFLVDDPNIDGKSEAVEVHFGNPSDGLQNKNYNSNKEGLLVDDPNIDGKSVAVKVHFGNPICMTSKTESMEEKNVGPFEEPDAKLMGSSDFHVAEGCGQDSEILAEASGQNASGLCTELEAVGQDIQVGGDHTGSTLVPVVEPGGHAAYGGSTAADERIETHSRLMDVDGIKPRATFSSLAENEASEGKNDCSNLACSSTELLEPHAIRTSEAGVHTDTIAESTKICSHDGLAGQSDINVGSLYVSIGAGQSIEPAFDRCAMDHNASGSITRDEGIALESVRFGSGGSTGKLEESKHQSDAAAGDKSGIDIDQQELEKLPAPTEEFKHPDKEGADAGRVPSSADLSVVKTSSDAITEQYPVSDSAKGAACEAGGQLLSEKSGQTLPVNDTFSPGSQSDQQAAKPNKDGECGTRDREIYPAVSERKKAEAGGAEGLVVPKKPEEAIVKENDEAEIQKVSETEPIPDKLSLQPQPGAVPFNNLGNGKDGQIDNNTANMESSGNSIDAQDAMPSAKCDAFKVGGSSNASALFESPMKSHVPESGNISTEPESSPHSTMTKTSQLGQGEARTDTIKKPEDQNIPFSMLVDSQGLKGNDISSGEGSLHFDVTSSAELSVKKGGKNLKRFAPVQASVASPIVGSHSTPSLEKTDAKTTKGTSERKTRRMSRAAGKEASKKGNSAKDTTPLRPLQSGSKTSIVTQTSPIAGQIVQSIETASIIPFGTFSTSVSSLPDLNSSTLSAVFQRPFTDLQQVQLRAQIFVYGALIQGTAPDEAYMISAFGGPDGGKSSWENAWRACWERTQKSHVTASETPLQSRSGARAPDQTMKSALQGKIAFPLVGQASGKDASVVNPIMPPSSPLWSMPTPRDTLKSINLPKGAVPDHRSVLSSLHPHQITPVKNHVGHHTSWISTSPYLGPWVASPQTNAFATGTRFSGFPVTEPVKLTPAKESSLPHSGATHLSKDSGVISSSVVKGTPVVDPKNVIVAPGQHSTDSKSRKRKKFPVSEKPGQITLLTQPETVSCSAPLTPSHVLTSVSITTPANLVSKSSQEKLVPFLSPSILAGHGISGNRETDQRSVLSEETLGKLKEARMHAEDATTVAAAAVSHSEYVWKQVDQKKNSGLEPEIQNRLASAAVAIAAAAAVAKAASAAANVASNAALQAKLMAEEAFASNTSGPGNDIYIFDGIRSLGQATPASILKGDVATVSSSSVLTAAREAARKRVEAASAATKRAENMDAIVKAAELAAEAVSQAGKLVTMGDPLPLNELVEAGPDNYWKHTRSTPEWEPSKGGSFDNKEIQVASQETSASQRDMSTELDDHARVVDSVSGSVSAAGKRVKLDKGHTGATDLAKTATMASEPEAVLKSSFDSQTESEQIAETSKENGIGEGSNVEVFKEGPGGRKAWYSANILSLKDGEAYVSYTELSSDKGAEKLKEWVALEDESGGAPKVRTARPIMPFEGTRKRRRAAIGDYNWAVGDNVDAWVHDSWWEGVVTEKNKKDETTLTVHFPAQGETLTVKAWHLRPSLVWKDGKWTECSSLGGNSSSPHEGDTPNEKRARLVSPAREVKGKDKSSKTVDLLESGKPQQPPFLELTASDKTFNIGRSTKDDNKPDPLRMKRTGLQKQGSRVIFGVPKPGKKRKFMEVSKHYVTGPSGKPGEPGDSVKFTKYLMPQASASRVWGRNIPKGDPKEKQAAVSKPKVFKAVSKHKEKPSATVKTIPQKEGLQSAAVSDVDADAARDHTAENKGSVSTSSAGEATEDQTSLSSLDVSPGASSKKTFSLSSRAEQANKGKLAPAAGRLAKIEENKVLSENSTKSSSDVVEPRRSNRRIQPTSRLLEGLQTSMMTSKIPSVSHGKGHQSQSKNASRGK